MCICPNTVNNLEELCYVCLEEYNALMAHGSTIEIKGDFLVKKDVAAPVVDAAGVKHDQGKPDYSYISRELMDEMARVREFGAIKYSRDNWRNGFKYQRSIAAALRHIFAFKDGEDLDHESGLTHIGHALCCLEHLLYDFKHHKHNDDRFKT